MTDQAEILKSAVESGAARALRQSTLNDYEICARRAMYALDPPGPRRTSEAALIGTGYHAGLEAYYQARMNWESGKDFHGDTGRVLHRAHNGIVNEIEKYDPKNIAWDTNPTTAIKIAQEMLEAYLTEGHAWGLDYKILGVEVPFWLPSDYPGWVLHGTIDLVVEGPDPRAEPDRELRRDVLILDDHKTSSRKWKAQKSSVRGTSQAAMYLDAWAHMGDGPAADLFSFSIMQRNGTFERRYVYPSAGEWRAFYLKRDLIVRQLSSGDQLPPTTTSNLCSQKYCSWWQQCEFGAAMDGAA